MAVLRKRRRRVSVGLGALVFALVPNTIGFQDLGALLVRQPGVAARAHAYVIASPFATIRTATFSLPNPIGTGIPHPPIYALANFDPADITGSIGAEPLGDGSGPLRFPTANRKTKRDSLLSRPREPMPPLPPLLAIEPVPDSVSAAVFKKEEAEGRFDPYAQYEFPATPDERSATPDVDLPYADLPPANLTPAAPKGGTMRLFDRMEAVILSRKRILRTLPLPPRQRPLPPESWRIS